MTGSGAPAALQGYRLQGFYTLKRIFGPGIDGSLLFQPEGEEDLDIRDGEGKFVESIQVKSYDGLVLSDLEPGRENSFFHRALRMLEGEDTPVIRLVNFGPIGPELSQSWDGDEAHREQVITKLVDKGFKRYEIEELFNHVELVSLDEEEEYKALLARIRSLSVGIDPDNALDLFIAWYYHLAEQRQAVSCADLIEKVNAVGLFLAERYQYHQQWHTTIEPLEAFPIDEELLSQLCEEFYAGVRARYEHILADLDFPREHKITEILQGFQKSNVVIVHAASGQGKSTLAYRYLHDMYPSKWRFSIKRVQDVQHALQIALALSGFAKAVEVPIAVYLDVHPRDTEWTELVRQLASQPFLEILVTIREEDYRRANIVGTDFNFTDVSLGFDQAEAELIYERARVTSERWDFLDFDSAWDAFGGEGPLMEFVYLLTQTQTLQERLESQVQRIENEVREGRASPDELLLLSLVGLSSAYGARLYTREVVEALDLPAPNLTLKQFEQEYLLRRTTDGMYLEGLHPIRSNILSELLIRSDTNPWRKIVRIALPLLIEEDLETFILHALVDTGHREDHSYLLELVISVQPKTWSGVAGILRSLLWAGAQEYVRTNRSSLDAAYEELGPAWLFAVDINFALPGEGPEVGEWWTNLGSLIPPERQARIEAIRESQSPKEEVFQRPQEWLRSLSGPPLPPSTSQDWREVAEFWYWVARLAPDKSFDWITDEELDAVVEDVPLTILADLSFSLHLHDPARHERWLETHEDTLYRRLAYQQNILAFEDLDTTLKIHFIPSGDTVQDDSDPLHAETMAKIELVRRIFPGYEHYGSQGYVFKLAGMQLPQGDSTCKDGVPATHLLPKWLIWLNGAVTGIARLRYRPDSWDAYLNMMVENRRLITDCLDELNRGLVKFHQRDKPINVGQDYVDLEAWQRCWERLGGVMDLPTSAVDPWGLASERAVNLSLRTLVQQQYVPTAVALQKYKPYLKAHREYFSWIRSFFEQAIDVWITNANIGKFHPNDQKRKLILEELHKKDVKTDSVLSVYNLFDAKAHLRLYQKLFRELFVPYLSEDEINALEEREVEVLTTTWVLWYYYACEPWKGAANPRRQLPDRLRIAKHQLRRQVEQALERIQTPERGATLLDYDRQWNNSPALWIKLDLEDPMLLYTSLIEVFPTALRSALGHIEPNGLTYYLVQEICQYVVVTVVVRGQMLNELVWPFHTLTILQSDDVKEEPWAYLPQGLTDAQRDELALDICDRSEILLANNLSRSVATLHQLTAQIAELQGMPDLTEPGMERLQNYLMEELGETLSSCFQTYLDTAEELCEQFNALPEDEQQERNKLLAAVQILLGVHEDILPGKGNETFNLSLAETVAYSQRLEEAYPKIEDIRLLWIADCLRDLQ